MKKNAIFVAVILLAYSFIGCDDGNGETNDVFTSSTNETVLNDISSLGLIGTSVSSSNVNIATAIISSEKIKITSVSQGSAVITVSENANSATINVTVSATGGITIGTITKYNNEETSASTLIITNFTGILTNNQWLDGDTLNDGNILLYFSAGVPTSENPYPKGAKITGSTITLKVYLEKNDTFSLYTGNHTIAAGHLHLFDNDTETYDDDLTEFDVYENKVPITFTNGNANINFATMMELAD